MDLNTNIIHRKRRSADKTDDQDTSQIRVYEFFEPRHPPLIVHNPKEALEAKDLANDTFFYEKLKASIPKLKQGEKDDVELIKDGNSNSEEESLAINDDTDESGDESEDSEGSEESLESEGSEESDDDEPENEDGDKSSLTMEHPNKSKDIEFVQNPDTILKEVEKAFQNNNRYIEQEQESGDDESEEQKAKEPIFKTKKFSRDFDSASDLLKEVHTIVEKKKSQPDDGNHYWKIEYQNPTVRK